MNPINIDPSTPKNLKKFDVFFVKETVITRCFLCSVLPTYTLHFHCDENQEVFLLFFPQNLMVSACF